MNSIQLGLVRGILIIRQILNHDLKNIDLGTIGVAAFITHQSVCAQSCINCSY